MINPDEPTEARQDELAGITTGVVEIICEACLPYICAHWNKPAEERIEACKPLKNWVTRWFSLTVSSGGGDCPRCKGEKILIKGGNACLTCKGTGQKPIVTKTLGEIIKGALK